MNYNNRLENDSTMTIRVVCAVAFVTFAFVFLCFRQADVMAVAQHVLSGGKTIYIPVVGALLITFLLYMLQRVINAYLHIYHRMHWTTYFPPMLLLAIVSDIGSGITTGPNLGAWVWVAPLVLAIWAVVSLALKNIQKYESDIHSRGIFSRLMWVNIFPMGFMMMAVGLISANDDMFHYRAKMERLMTKGEWEKAVEVGEKSLEKDTIVTMLRCYALARSGKMAEEMFKYAVGGTSETLLPLGKSEKMLIYPIDSLYRFLGARPLDRMTTRQYLNALEASGYGKKAIADYKLCGLLVDRDIDAFVRELPQYYTINDSLPLHYREALTLYTHKRSTPIVVYHNQVMDTDFEDLQKLADSKKNPQARRLAVFDQYYGTYWWYYEYGR